MWIPVILGHGRRLWAETPDKSTWTLTEATPYGDGVLVTIHRSALAQEAQ